MALSARLEEYRRILMKRAIADFATKRDDEVEPPERLSADAIAQAVANALAQFTNEEGALRVAPTKGVRPYGGG